MAVRPTTLVGQKTYWHLTGARKVPSRYEIATSRLHWYTTHGLLVSSPVASFYTKNQAGSPLQLASNDDWEAFADPAETTYGQYVEERASREIHVDQVLASASAASPSSSWTLALDPILSTFRFPRHALMMVASYVGSLAPCARVTIAGAFQAADETRNVHRLAERIVQLRSSHEKRDEKAIWTTDPSWQPLRRLIEELLATYDWGEAFVALNVVVKPLVDRVAIGEVATCAEAAGDIATRDMLRSLAEDAAWHVRWTQALLAHVVTRRKENLAPIEEWTKKWEARVVELAVTSHLKAALNDLHTASKARATGGR